MSLALPYLALGLAQVLFGINFIISKKIVALMDPLYWCFFRLILASIIIIPICFLLKRKPITLNRKNLTSLLILSLFGIILNQGAFLIGLSKTTATNSSILLSTVPIFTLIIVAFRK